jgi:D-alanyl-D-alanine carboxypeptidase
MMSQGRSFCVTVLAVVLHTFEALPQTPVDPAFAAALDQRLDSCVQAFNVPGISASLLLPGDRAWNGASGVAHIYTEVPVDTAHLFQLASVTKLYTAATIFQLIDEGSLDLDDPIGDHLPMMPDITPSIPLRYLLNHRSGLAEFLSDPDAAANWFDTPDSIFQPVDVITSYSSPPIFNPNASFSYSNTNYVLLGMIIEQVTGNTVAEEFRQRFLDPMDLSATFLPPHEPIQGEMIPGWTSFSAPGVYDTDATPVLADCFASMVFTAGALVAPPSDVARFARSLFAAPLVSENSMATMLTFTNVNFSDGCTGYGHGVMRYPLQGRTFYGHGGDISGFTQLAIHHVSDSITLVVSINRNNAPRVPIANALLQVVYDQLATSVGEHHGTTPFLTYPVPATSTLNIVLRDSGSTNNIQLVDAVGRVIMEQRAQATNVTWNVEHLAAGIYHVRLHEGGRIWHQQVILE